MECGKVREMLAAYLEGAIAAEQERTVRDHLSSCRECSAAAVDIKKTAVLVRSLEEVEPPPWLTQKVMAHVREEAQKKRGLFGWLFYPLRVKVPIEAFATLLVVVMAVYLYETNVPQYEEARVARGTIQSLPPDSPSAAPHKEADLSGAKKEKTEVPSPRQDQGAPPSPSAGPEARQERQARDEAATRAEVSKAAPAEQKSLGQAVPTPAPAEDRAAERKTFSTAPQVQERQRASAPEVSGPEPRAALSRQERAPDRPAAAPAPSAATGVAPEKGGERIDFTLRATDVGAAAQEVERMLDDAGARRLTRESGTGSETVAGMVNGDKVEGLARKLRTLGAKGDFNPAVHRGDTVAVRVGISDGMKADEKGVK